MISRRSFFAGIASTAVSACIPRLLLAQTPGALVGSQLYGWGQFLQREGKSLDSQLDEIFAALRDAGFDYAEHSLNSDPAANMRLGARMKSHGLKPVSFYTGGTLHDAAKAEKEISRLLAAAQGARDAGFTIINCNPDPIGRPKTDAELITQAKSLQALGEGLAKLGMKLGVHNHTPEMEQNAREFHHNFQHTDSNAVGFCYDVHWVFRGGIKPADALAAYGKRIVSWHLRQSRGGIWWEDLDTGDIDFAAIAAYAHQNAISPIYTVEIALESGTKVTRSATENHLRSRQFVRQTFGA